MSRPLSWLRILPLRAHEVADLEQRPTHVKEPLDDARPRARHDVALQYVDLVADAVDDGEVAVHDEVDDGIQQQVGALGEESRGASAVRAETLQGSPSRGMGGDQEARSLDDVHLVVDDVLGVLEGEQDKMQAVIPEHDLGALVALDDVFGDEVVQLEHGGETGQRLSRCVLDVNP